jgi:alkylation response protein AidB-like acyl-CoA dehydrogenase
MSVATKSLLSRLLREVPEPLRACDDVAAWWRGLCATEPRATTPIDRAVIAGFRADRLAGAFAGGYQAALRTLVPGSCVDECIFSLCVTEQAGNSPRAIEAALTPRAGGGFALSGRKRWSTMAPLASVLLVAASEGADASGRKRFKLVRVEADRPGVTIHRMPPTQFVPEVPHAELELVDVALGEDAPLPGDGYTQYVKRFRTIEDIHIHGAILGYVL